MTVPITGLNPLIVPATLTDLDATVSSVDTETYKRTAAQLLALMTANSSIRMACRVGTALALNATYNNGVSGVGATLTNAGPMAALVIDGVTVNIGDRVLVWHQGSAATNGIYVVTVAGSGVVNWVLTRASDFDNSQPGNVAEGVQVLISEGTENVGEIYYQTTPGPITVGTTFLVFAQAGPQVGSGFVQSVSGTAGRVTSSGGADPVINIDPAYVGQTSITTLGTVAIGVWNGTPVGILFGGSNATTANGAFNNFSPLTTKGDVIGFNGSINSRLPVGNNGFVLTADSSAAVGFSWQLNASGNVSGPGSAIANGITRFNGMTGQIIKSGPGTIDDSANMSINTLTATAATSQLVLGSTTVNAVPSAPFTVSIPDVGSNTNFILGSSAAGVGQSITTSGSIGSTPIFQIANNTSQGAGAFGQYFWLSNSGMVATEKLAMYLGKDPLTNDSGFILYNYNGASNAGSYLNLGNSSSSFSVNIYNGAQGLVANNSTMNLGSLASPWATLFTTNHTITSFTANGVVLNSNAGVLSTQAMTNGQFLIGSTGLQPVANTLTAGLGININNAPGAVTISASGGGFEWVDQTSSPATLVDSTGYIANLGTLLNFVLPVTAAVGETFVIVGNGVGQWTISQNAAQTINVGSTPTTTGITGSVASQNRYDCINLTCTIANTTFSAYGIQGNLTVN